MIEEGKENETQKKNHKRANRIALKCEEELKIVETNLLEIEALGELSNNAAHRCVSRATKHVDKCEAIYRETQTWRTFNTFRRARMMLERIKFAALKIELSTFRIKE